MELKGKVLLSTSLGYVVHLTDGSEVTSSKRKTLDIKKGNIIIGDDVLLDENKLICDIFPRKNILSRPRVCNVEIAGIIISAKEPFFSTYLLDKYLSSCYHCNVPALIIVSKWDLLSSKEQEEINNKLQYYENLGYSVYRSSKNDTNIIDELKNKLQNKITIFMGQTGVGKSSLINKLDPNCKRAIGNDVVLGRGQHKTKEVALIPFLGGYLGDTPGFSDFKLDLNTKELSISFPGYYDYSLNCKFNDCNHLSIKNCAVKEAVDNDELSLESYNNYIKLINEESIPVGFNIKSSHSNKG